MRKIFEYLIRRFVSDICQTSMVACKPVFSNTLIDDCAVSAEMESDWRGCCVGGLSNLSGVRTAGQTSLFALPANINRNFYNHNK